MSTQGGLPFVVFSDVDRVVFGDGVPDDGEARTAFSRLADAGIHVVLCSCQTRAEIAVFQQRAGISEPFICEDGAAVCVPDGYFSFELRGSRNIGGCGSLAFGLPYADVTERLYDTAARLRVSVVGFSQMTVHQVADASGISPLRARLRTLREYTEPFTLIAPDLDASRRLLRALRAARVDVVSRRDFHYAGAVRRDIGAQALCGFYRRACGSIRSVAFADHAASAPLLLSVDIPVIVDSDDVHHTRALGLQLPHARVERLSSIRAWAEAILAFAWESQPRPVQFHA